MRSLALCSLVAVLSFIDLADTTLRMHPEEEEPLDIRDEAEYHRHYSHPRPGHHHQLPHYHPNYPHGHYHHHHHHPQVPYGHHQHVHPGQPMRPHHHHPQQVPYGHHHVHPAQPMHPHHHHHHQRQHPRYVQLQDDSLSEFIDVDAEDDFP